MLGTPGQVTADVLFWADAFAVEPPAGTQLVTLRNRAVRAAEVLALQTQRNERTSVLVLVAPGTVPGEFPAANLAVAGAFIEALSELGVDHTSPEAATALAAWQGVKPARKHLLRASGAARASTQPEQITHALELDAD